MKSNKNTAWRLIASYKLMAFNDYELSFFNDSLYLEMEERKRL